MNLYGNGSQFPVKSEKGLWKHWTVLKFGGKTRNPVIFSRTLQAHVVRVRFSVKLVGSEYLSVWMESGARVFIAWRHILVPRASFWRDDVDDDKSWSICVDLRKSFRRLQYGVELVSHRCSFIYFLFHDCKRDYFPHQRSSIKPGQNGQTTKSCRFYRTNNQIFVLVSSCFSNTSFSFLQALIFEIDLFNYRVR